MTAATPQPRVILLFGGTGDLARRKLIPALLHLFDTGLLRDFEVVGVSLDELSTEEFRDLAARACADFSRDQVDPATLARFLDRLSYVGHATGAAGLAAAVGAAASRLGGSARVLHYLSIPPIAAPDVVETIRAAGLAADSSVVLEKPFGTDLANARALNETVHQVFAEDQIFRIDHFLGKEAAQNILAMRFANGLFEPIWNRNHIDHIQIDVPETLGVEGRSAFYEGTGAYRDMVVSHLLQVLAFVAMEPPTSLSPRAISAEKDRVFESLRPIQPADVVRGQYDGYRDHRSVAPDSQTETLIALRAEVDNWRWSGVPFFLRTGKRLAEGARIISIAFREPPRSMFPPESGPGRLGPDHLTFDLADSSRLSLSFYGKRPGPGMTLDKLSMQFETSETDAAPAVLEAYERLVWDAVNGDPTLFTTAEGIERLWEVSAPLLDDSPPLHHYPPGSWGPDAVHDLIAPREWRLPFARRWREGRPGRSGDEADRSPTG